MDHTPNPYSEPPWEIFSPQTSDELLGLMAEEAWSRTGGRAHDAQIIEAELAHALGERILAHLHHARNPLPQLGDRAEQSAVFGFSLAAVLQTAPITGDLEDLFERTMHRAGLVLISTEV
jgi:hypothetical protein